MTLSPYYLQVWDGAPSKGEKSFTPLPVPEQQEVTIILHKKHRGHSGIYLENAALNSGQSHGKSIPGSTVRSGGLQLLAFPWGLAPAFLQCFLCSNWQTRTLEAEISPILLQLDHINVYTPTVGFRSTLLLFFPTKNNKLKYVKNHLNSYSKPFSKDGWQKKSFFNTARVFNCSEIKHHIS